MSIFDLLSGQTSSRTLDPNPVMAAAWQKLWAEKYAHRWVENLEGEFVPAPIVVDRERKPG